VAVVVVLSNRVILVHVDYKHSKNFIIKISIKKVHSEKSFGTKRVRAQDFQKSIPFR
jgi:hypothetical protein